ncbi:hypothetical protein HY993_04615 [Candidatus Micrarchaeota archaeon]|nr:hypothetical protein [Candidatus Micrarchaeota archaeon]
MGNGANIPLKQKEARRLIEENIRLSRELFRARQAADKSAEIGEKRKAANASMAKRFHALGTKHDDLRADHKILEGQHAALVQKARAAASHLSGFTLSPKVRKALDALRK